MMEFIKSILSNESGTGSSNRMSLLLVVVCLLGWTTKLVIGGESIPAIPETWVWLIGVLVGAVSLNKGVDAVKVIKAPAAESEPET